MAPTTNNDAITTTTPQSSLDLLSRGPWHPDHHRPPPACQDVVEVAGLLLLLQLAFRKSIKLISQPWLVENALPAANVASDGELEFISYYSSHILGSDDCEKILYIAAELGALQRVSLLQRRSSVERASIPSISVRAF
jgi:hypothetical protein